MLDAWLSPSVLLSGAGLAAAGVAAWVDLRARLADLAARLAILEREVEKLRSTLHETRGNVATALLQQEVWERERGPR